MGGDEEVKSLIFCPGRLKTRLFVVQEGEVGGVRVEGGVEGTCFLGRMQAAGGAGEGQPGVVLIKDKQRLEGGSEPPPPPFLPDRNPCR